MIQEFPLALKGDTEVHAITKQAADVSQMAKECAIENAQSMEWATALLGEIAKATRAAETRRLFFTKPLNDHVKSINEFFKALVAPLVEADQILRRKVLVFREAERQRFLAEQARLTAERDATEAAARAAIMNPATSLADGRQALAAADAADDALAHVAAPPASTVKTVFGSSTARREWDFEVTDLALVPPEYWFINAPAVREAIRRGVRDIPGVRIYQKETLVVKPS